MQETHAEIAASDPDLAGLTVYGEVLSAKRWVGSIGLGPVGNGQWRWFALEPTSQDELDDEDPKPDPRGLDREYRFVDAAAAELVALAQDTDPLPLVTEAE